MAPLRHSGRTRFPPGATVSDDGVNFCIFSRHATRVELLLYASRELSRALPADHAHAEHNRTFFFWHVFVEGLPAAHLLHMAHGRPAGYLADGTVHSTRARSCWTPGRAR